MALFRTNSAKKNLFAVSSIAILLAATSPLPAIAVLDELSSRRNGSSFYDPDPISDEDCQSAEAAAAVDQNVEASVNTSNFASCIGIDRYNDCVGQYFPVNASRNIDVQADLWRFLITAGLSEVQVAGILGNLYQESRLDPTASNPSGAYGLAQWVGPRRTALEKYAQARKAPVSSWQVQAEFLVYELTGIAPLGVDTSGVPGAKSNARAYDDLIKRTLVDEAAASWALLFERYDDAIDYREIMEANGYNTPAEQIPPPSGFKEHFDYAFNTEPNTVSPRPEGFDRNASVGGGTRIGYARSIYEQNGGTFEAPGRCLNTEVVIGNTYEGSTCEAGTDVTPPGGAEGYANGERYLIRICNVQGIVVNSEIAVNVDLMLIAAKKDGITLTGGGFRSMEGQIAARKRNCGGRVYGGVCRPPTATPGYSNHQMGLAIDFVCNGIGIINIASRPGTKVCFSWLKANAESYGLFNLPSENWHWSINGK